MDMNKNYREGFICYDNAYKFLENPNNWIFAAICDKMIIGFAYGYELNRLNDIGNMIYVHEVGVMEQYQRQGIGYRMMSELKDACREKKICRYFLSTYQNNVGANALYRKLGGECSFESNGNDRNYFIQTK
jgi:ribosomal protein S18 acetylase RimI-like enzyme